MSKKKSSSAATMTLKDFHGGSIPSDLPLPSAPGVTARPADRPRSSNSIRSLDVRTPFLSNNAHIGRNFDEDERKPLDGGNSGPRRTVIDEIITAPPVLGESRSDVERFLGAPPSSKVSLASSRAGYPNAWAVRKEPVTVADAAPSPYVGQGQSNVSKIAQASALDQVASGRWQTKPIRQPADVEQVESPMDLQARPTEAYHGVNVRDYSEKTSVMQEERNVSMGKNIQNVASEVRGGERLKSPVLLGAKERISGLPTASGPQVPAEASERPKLKLLPRTRPLEASELSSLEHKHEQKFQQSKDSSHLENSSNMLGNVDHVKPRLAGGDEGGNQLVERPKLNLKPRSQPIELAKESTDRPRVTVFGGARPRELVLKERGVDDALNNEDVVRSPIKVKSDTPHTDNTVSVHSNALRHGEKVMNTDLDHRTGKSTHWREQRGDAEKAEVQRNSWRNDNWKVRHEEQKQPLQQQQQETWRKPIEQPKPASSDASGVRHGKAASAVELAQAYSRSVSDPQKKPALFSGPHGIPVGTKIPFSRLTGSTAGQRVNGY